MQDQPMMGVQFEVIGDHFDKFFLHHDDILARSDAGAV
jgi:hypothetical protein